MKKKLIRNLIVQSTLFSTLACIAYGHGIWVETRYDVPQIVLGEGSKDNAYDGSAVKSVMALDSDNSTTDIKIVNKEKHSELNYDAKKVAIVAVNFDYGYWTKTLDKKLVNEPMNKVEGATSGTHAIKYAVTYVGAVKTPKLIQGIDMQFVPSVDPSTLKLGEKFSAQLFFKEKPMKNTPVIADVVTHSTEELKTDDNGVVTLTVKNNGLNVVGVEVAMPINDATGQATQEKYFATLTYSIDLEK